MMSPDNNLLERRTLYASYKLISLETMLDVKLNPELCQRRAFPDAQQKKLIGKV